MISERRLPLPPSRCGGSQTVRRDGALDGVDFTLDARRGPRPPGRERSGQEHPGQDPERRSPARRGTCASAAGPSVPPIRGSGRRRGVSMIYQELTLAPHLTVEENCCPGPGERPPRLSPAQSSTATRSARRSPFSITPKSAWILPGRGLGVGARQIVEIARAIMDRSRILVMDEPTSSLTREDTDRLFQVIRKLPGRRRGDRLYQPFPGGGSGSRRRLHRPARRPQRRRRPDRRRDARGDIIQLMVGRKMADLFPAGAGRKPGPCFWRD